MNTFRIISRTPALLTLTTLATFTSTAALADGQKAVSTAAQHAGMAAASADLASAQRHLHHVLNCLVGPDGADFDAASGNPCAAAGGAIPQTSDAKMQDKLQKVAKATRTAMVGEDVEAVKKAAAEIEKSLK